MNENKYVVITWPDVQELMEVDGFLNNSHPINDNPLLDEYGPSAYFVRETWIYALEQEMRDNLMDININDE